MYQSIAKPFKHAVINWLCIYNESTLFIIALMQTIFITDIIQVSVVVSTGWAMIALTVSMIFVNFVVVIANVVKNKFKKTGENTQNVFDETNCKNNVTTYRNSAVTTSRHEIMHRNSRRLEE